MNKLPLISVLVAAYNVDRYIEKCIESIRNQSYKNLEIIVVNDCSKDRTGEICDSLALKDSRVKVVHHTQNKRLPGARNTGLDEATGEYIMFVDGDDWLASDCVEYLYGVLVKTDADISISCTNFTSRDLKQTENDYIETWSPEEATANFLFSRIPIGAWDKLYKRQFIELNNIRFKPLFTAEGFRFISDCSQRCNKVAVGHRRVYYYRLNNPKSATTLPDIRQGLGAWEALNGIENDLVIRTDKVMRSIRHHRLLNKFYTLRIIIENKSDKEYSKEYNDCLAYIKKNGIHVSIESHAKKLFIKTLFPILSSKIEIKKKNRELKKDIENDCY